MDIPVVPYETPQLSLLGTVTAIVRGDMLLVPEDKVTSVITSGGDLVLGLDE